MSLRSRFQSLHPEAYFLDGSNLPELQSYLLNNGRLLPGERIRSVEKPGEGNMNCVLRVITSHRRFIVKQARPWVEKYPQIPAPVERSAVEALYLKNSQKHEDLRDFSPRIWWSDPDNFILAQEDLGMATDYTFLYQKEHKITAQELETAIRYLHILHHLPISSFPENMEMRRLNHEHIFHFPFQLNNGFNLDTIQSGLEEVAVPYKTDVALKDKISRLGEIYLSPGRCLIHGDFYPGSWLKTSQGIKIIDPEFAFYGHPEFDLAVMMAHVMLADQGKQTLIKIWNSYNPPANFDHRLLSAFTGVEIMRRIMGIAQLSLSMIVEAKAELLKIAAGWIKKGNLTDQLTRD
jgi:5-methylthioribose kinase